MAHAQKPDFVFGRNGRVHLNRRGLQFSRILAAKVCASAVVMLDIPCSEAMWRVLATHSIRQFPLHFPSRASPCAITFQLDSTLYHGTCELYKQQRIELYKNRKCPVRPPLGLLKNRTTVHVIASKSVHTSTQCIHKLSLSHCQNTQ